MNITNNQFHTSQILLSDKVKRYSRYSSHAVYSCAISLCLFTFIPSHISLKILNIGFASLLFGVSNRLDKLRDYASGYSGISEQQSHVGYATWLQASLAPPRREVAIAQPITPIASTAPVKFADVKAALAKPHIMVLGETGSGKSTLVKYLVSQSSAPSLVLDSHAAPDDWENMQVIGAGRNYQAIGEEVDRLVRLMDARYEQRSNGTKSFETLLIILDEFTACVANLGKPFTEGIMLLVRESRKVSIRLIILSQGSEVKALGIEGQGSIRECFAMVSLGKFALERAKSLKDEQIKAFIDSAQFPAMLDDIPCQLPNIDRVNLPVLSLPNDYLALIGSDDHSKPSIAIAPVPTEPSQVLAPVFTKIVQFLDGRDWTRDNYIKQSIAEFKNADTPIEEIQGYLQFLEVQGHLETRGAGRNGLEAKKI